MSRLIGHKLLLSRELLYLAPTGHIPDTPWEPPDPGGLQQQEQRHAGLRPSVDCSPGKLENPCPAPQIIKGSGARGEEDWKPRRKVSQSGGWEGRGSHVKWPYCRPPRGKREHSISSFQHISLWRRERRHAVQGKQCGSWRGGPHVVCVSGRLDLEGFTPSGSQSLLSQKSQSRLWRPPCTGSLGSHVVLGTGQNDIPGPAGHGSLSLEILSPRGAGLAKY